MTKADFLGIILKILFTRLKFLKPLLYTLLIMSLIPKFYINTLMLFWPILGQMKTSLVVFLWKRRTSSVICLVILFHKSITKLVLLWLNMDQKSIKVLIIYYFYFTITHANWWIKGHYFCLQTQIPTKKNKNKRMFQ